VENDIIQSISYHSSAWDAVPSYYLYTEQPSFLSCFP
jgi:hypothetical protein